jgi:hypothetical protein
MKKITMFLLLVFMSIQLKAQKTTSEVESDTSYWKKEILGGLNINQASFSGNWQGGGVNSLAFGGYIKGRSNYAKDKLTWDNTLDMIYGIVKNENEDGRKSNDRIYLDSKIGYKINKNWNYYFAANFQSQFAPGYKFGDNSRTLISNFMNPGFLIAGMGFEYKKNEEFSLRIAPFAPRLTFVSDKDLHKNVTDNYGVPIGKTIRYEWLALNVVADWNKKITENLILTSRYQMFANLETLAFKTIDHRLDLSLTAKVSKIVNVSLTSISVYDLDQDKNIQFSQGLALGIAFRRANF